RHRPLRAGERGPGRGEGGQGVPQALRGRSPRKRQRDRRRAAPVTTRSRSNFVPADGTDVYYEVWGDGPPALLIHGAFGSTRQFSGLLPAITRIHTAICVDLQGHGRTA